MPSGGFVDGVVKERVWHDGSNISPSDSFSFNNSTSQRTFLVSQGDYKDFVTKTLGYSEIRGGKLHRQLPAFHPVFEHLTATRIVSVRPAGRYTGAVVKPEGKVNQFLQLEVVVEYGFINCDFLTDDQLELLGGTELDRYVIYTNTPEAEYLTLPPGVLQWATSSPPAVPIPFSVGRIQYTQTLVYKWLQLPFELLDAGGYLDRVIQQTLGGTNLTEFDGWPSATLILEAATPERIRAADGTWMWDLTYRMKFNPIGVNRLLRRTLNSAGVNVFTPNQVTTDGNLYDDDDVAQANKVMYNPKNFDRLFQVTD